MIFYSNWENTQGFLQLPSVWRGESWESVLIYRCFKLSTALYVDLGKSAGACHTKCMVPSVAGLMVEVSSSVPTDGRQYSLTVPDLRSYSQPRQRKELNMLAFYKTLKLWTSYFFLLVFYSIIKWRIPYLSPVSLIFGKGAQSFGIFVIHEKNVCKNMTCISTDIHNIWCFLLKMADF